MRYSDFYPQGTEGCTNDILSCAATLLTPSIYTHGPRPVQGLAGEVQITIGKPDQRREENVSRELLQQCGDPSHMPLSLH